MSQEREEQEPSLTEMEYETPSESSEDHSTATAPTSPPNAPPPRLDTPKSPSRAWYQFDFAVVIALLSPVGNLLTGGDLIKNLIYILFLLFYLHQIIEVPWNMYHAARMRQHPRTASPPPSSPQALLAETELHRVELFLLALSSVAPFAGAYLLRYILLLIAGRDILSWFSTNLFVLATGIRPWTHILDRLSQRVETLHDVIHYPPTNREVPDRVDRIEERIDMFERRLRETNEEAFEYVDEAIDGVEKNQRRHERRCEKSESRMRELEMAVEALRGKVKRMPMHLETASKPWLLEFIFPSQRRVKYPPSASPKYSLHSFSTSAERLDTIPEEMPTAPPPPPPPTLVKTLTSLITLPLRPVIYVLSFARIS
ncbi:hypothetical protein BDZ89DRAFT_1141553 [Hymenopellis radicata]|nr:hypothetical protein BDZ89DRAFT_1141553 [Hymenopellis radicata]